MTMGPKKTRKATKKVKSKKENKENINLANVVSKYDASFDEYKMYFAENRLKTFTSDWPFDEDSACNPTSLSDAGFYHIPSSEAPDACRCFCCYKELDGWEPEDDPREEHKKHSGSCTFLSLKKPVEQLTVQAFLKLECDRQVNKAAKHFHMKIQEVEDYCKTVEKEMKKLTARR
ncbi:baculoviral IAP repeat-containing protein 5-like [Mya arenaria]|uniref:baculoviral IAP repeat-containing protein 5-like n=1 Tax=Mya arenaria TaxID=6604 RepID=UPI0022E2FC5A|nr:baculoviral IAP repeat-containing protein 5-like [Mya arenaria]